MKILTQNMWLLPFGFSKDNKKRLKLLVDYIEKNEIDIICLQEVWKNSYISYLKKNIKKKYFFSYNKTKFWNKSGLICLTKIKPKNVEFFEFKKSKDNPLINKIAKRGFLKLSFKEYDIYNTHLYYKTDIKIGLKIALKEFEQLKKNIHRFSIICGDLNIDKKIFDKINTFYYADNIENTFSSKNKYSKKWWEKKVILDKKIDYILTTKKVNFKSYAIEGLSDHEGILSEIILN
ncbi:MAG: endonuclease/exonuclease/phosphatase family protein [Candidatus Woesearchaeota archaeon]